MYDKLYLKEGIKMFSKVKVQNYKNFPKLSIDFNKNKQKKVAKNVISIYGENGSGKSNIIHLFSILVLSTDTLNKLDKYNEVRNMMELNEEKEFALNKYHIDTIFFGNKYSSLTNIVKNCKTINSKEKNMSLSYEFILNGHSGVYDLEFNDKSELVMERLSYLVDKRKRQFFKVNKFENKININLSPSVFKNSNLNNAFLEQIEKLWGKHSFLAIIANYTKQLNENFIVNNLSDNLMLILNYFGTLSVSDNDMFYSEAYKQNKILEDLIKGHIAKEEKNKILETEKLVSKYFVSLYSDIKDMKYIIAEKDDSISYELMCYKTIDSKIIEIPFELESKGTKKLLNLLPLMIDAAMGKTVIIDEIDEGIHDLLVNNLVQNIIESINGQIIFTTHDTYLMEQLPKKSMYIIKSDALGNKTIDSLDKYKIDSNNNPAKMYLNGAFGGTPYPRDLDFEDMAEELNYEE
ncbi:hypothetical protein CU001_2554 [Enterococcus faecium]|nr:hypothetical protein [Enterococcus faecium]PQG20221.1 transporter [Enterococcus faecium]